MYTTQITDFRALFRPSVTASFLAFSIDNAFDFMPSLTPYPISSWYTPSYQMQFYTTE